MEEYFSVSEFEYNRLRIGTIAAPILVAMNEFVPESPMKWHTLILL
jgi:hypothetical protein